MSAGLIPKKIQDHIVALPTSLQYTTSNKGLKYGELLSAVDLMAKDRAIQFTHEEFLAEYGKHGIACLRAAFKKLKNPPFALRVVSNDAGVVIFKNDPPVKKQA